MVEDAFIQAEFRGHPVVGLAVTQHCPGFRISGIGVTALDYEIVDHPMEKETVEIVFLCQLDEVIPVKGCFVVEFEFHRTHGSLHHHHCFFLRFRRA